MSDIPKISDSSELIREIADASATDGDLMETLHAAIKHRDACTNKSCALCVVFRKHEQKRRDETWSFGRKVHVRETMSMSFLLSGEEGEQRRFRHTFALGSRVLDISKTSMIVSLRYSNEEDGNAVTISDWVLGNEPPEPRLENQPASLFAPNPLGSGCRLAILRDGDTLAFTARFHKAATLSVEFWGRLGTKK
jgi:hypothetical protein